jgi:outer membrane protein TolC
MRGLPPAAAATSCEDAFRGAGDAVRGYRAVSRIAGFDAGWELDLFGKHQRSLEAARHDAEAQMAMRNAVLITVIADVARNYLDARTLQMRLEIARKDVAVAQRTADLATTKFKRGPSNEPASQSSKQEGASSAPQASDDTAGKREARNQSRRANHRNKRASHPRRTN